MPFVPVLGSVAEVIMQGTLAAFGSNQKNVASVFHYRCALIVLPPTKVALEAAFQAGVCVPLIAAFNSRYVQSQNTVRYVDDVTDAPVSTARALVGAIATDPLPTRLAVYILLRTGLRKRYNMGSKHFPAASEVDTTGDVLTGAGLARWQTVQTAVGATLVDALGNSWVPCVFSRKKSQIAVNPTTIYQNDVTQVLLDKTLGQMRRRKVLTVR